MTDIKRKKRNQREGGRVLSFNQETTLIGGFPFGGGALFANAEEMKAAWFAHREELMAMMALFTRPYGYWYFEAGYVPQTGAGEHHEDALLRLGLPLTPAEQAELRKRKDLVK